MSRHATDGEKPVVRSVTEHPPGCACGAHRERCPLARSRNWARSRMGSGMKRPAWLDPRALARQVDLGQRLATIRRNADATRAAVRERVTGIRQDRVVLGLLLVATAVFIGVRFVPIDGVAAGVRSVLLGLGVVVLYRWFTKLEEEGIARLSEEHDEHEEDAAELLQMVERAESIAEGYAKRNDPEKALEWNFRAWEFARRAETPTRRTSAGCEAGGSKRSATEPSPWWRWSRSTSAFWRYSSLGWSEAFQVRAPILDGHDGSRIQRPCTANARWCSGARGFHSAIQ